MHGILSIIGNILGILIVLGAYALPVWLLLRIARRFLSHRLSEWQLPPEKALMAITAVTFSPILLAAFCLAGLSFINTDGQITWLDAAQATSIYNEAAWQSMILLAATWPFFLLYIIGGVMLTARLYRSYKQRCRQRQQD